MATGGSENASDEFSDIHCFTCNKNIAIKYCVECQGYLCQSCSDIHSRFPSMNGHTLLEKSNCKTLGSLTKLPEVPTERCKIHTIKLVDMYCKDHDEVGCTTCMALNHRSCKTVHSIPDDIEILFEESDIKDIRQNLQYCEVALTNTGQKKDALLAGLTSSKKEADISIENAKWEIVSHVANLEKKSKEKVKNLYQTAKICLEKEKKEASHQVRDLQKVTKDLITSEGNKTQQFVCMKLANSKIKKAKEVELSLKTETEAKVIFTMDPNIQTYFRKMKIFGKVSSLMLNTERTEPYLVGKNKDLKVKIKQDSTTCKIYATCLSENGSLLLVDANNNMLKRANITSMTVDGHCSFDNNPYGVCCTNRQEAIVTFYASANFIQFVSIGNQLTPSRKVQMSHNCLDIAYKEDKLYITDNAQTIYIHDMAGNELQEISKDSSGIGMFSCTRQIAFNDVTQGLFVADLNKGVIILDGHYQPVAVFTDSGLSNVSAVCTDRRGNIFVCGYSSYNVIQIGYDGKKRGVVVDKSHGVQTTRSVCFDPIQCRLIVTQHNDVVKIYYLK